MRGATRPLFVSALALGCRWQRRPALAFLIGQMRYPGASAAPSAELTKGFRRCRVPDDVILLLIGSTYQDPKQRIWTVGSACPILPPRPRAVRGFGPKRKRAPRL